MDPHSDQSKLGLLDLPLELIENVLSYLSFESIAEVRLVNRRFNVIGQQMLNKGFSSVDKYHVQCLRNIKSKLPRRESERKNHPLSRHCDILNTIETRISLLGMTFVKYIDLKMCCFIPGKVIDEIYRVLRLVQTSNMLPRAHELLQELRDISSMAMEHFDEKIVPTLKRKMLNNSSHADSSLTGTYQLSSSSFRQPKLTGVPKMEVLSVQKLNQQAASTMSTFRKNITDHKHKMLEMQKKIQEQAKTIVELNHTVTDLNAKVSEQEGRLNEMSRKLVDVCEQRSSPEMILPGVQAKRPSELRLRRSTRVCAGKTSPAATTNTNAGKRKLTGDDRNETGGKIKVAKNGK